MWGGARENAGRKKGDEETKIISFRVPEKYAAKLKALIKALIEKFIEDETSNKRRRS